MKIINIKNKIVLLVLLLSVFFSSVLQANSFYAFANSGFKEPEQSSPTLVEGLQVNNHKHYLSLSGATEFEKFGDMIAVVINSTLHIYNQQNYSFVALSEFNSASNLAYVNNHLFFVNNNQLFVLDDNLNTVNLTKTEDIENNENQNAPVTEKFTIQAYRFAISYDTNNKITKIAFAKNNQINLVLLDDNFNLITHLATALIDSKPVLSITLSSTFAYTFHSDGGATKPVIVKTNLTDLGNQTTRFVELKGVNKITYTNLNNTEIIAMQTNEEIVLNNESNLNEVHLVVSTNFIEHNAFALGELTQIADFKIINNQIFVLDSMNHSLQHFNIVYENNAYKLNNPQILIASKSYEVGRFNNPNHIFASNKNLQVITDTQNNRVIVVNKKMTTDFVEVEEVVVINNLNHPIKTQLDNHQNIYILDKSITNTYNIFKYNKSGVLTETFEFDETEQISSFSINSLGDIIALNSNNNEIIEINNSFDNLNRFELASVLVNNQSKIIQLYNGSILVQTNNTIYIIENQTVVNALTLDENILDLDIDFLNNVFVLLNNSIVKYSIENNKFVVENPTTLDLNETDNHNLKGVTLISIDKGTGQIYLFNNFHQNLVKATNTNFSSGLTSFSHPVDIFTHPLQTEFIQLFKTTKNLIAYEYPHYIGNSFEIEANKTVYLMKDYDNTFAMILFKSENSNFITKGYVLKSLLQEDFIENILHDRKLVAMFDIKVLTYPTTLKESANNTPIVELNLAKGAKLTAISNAFVGIDGNEYYAILWENNTIAYVLNHNLVFEANDENSQPIIKPNKKLFSEDSQIFVFGTNTEGTTVDENNVIDTLPNNYDVFVENFNKKSEYTLIRYYNSEEVQVVGFIKTENIKTNDLTETQLTSIIISVASVLLLSALGAVFTYNHKKNKE